MKKRPRVLMLFSSPYNEKRGYDYREEFADEDNMYTENDVHRALLANGFETGLLGVHDTLGPLFEEIDERKPNVIFNLVEVFNGRSHLEKNVGALLEMLNIPYTGASSENLFVCNNKALTKKILTYHRIKVPRFHTFYRGHKVWFPKRMRLPVVVKPLCEEASRGISQSSVVDSEEAFCERVRFIHDNMDMDAIAEEFIEGRELYVSIMGNKRLNVLPPREMKFGQLPEDARIATYKAKWDDNYRERWNIKSVHVGNLPKGVWEDVQDVCKRAYRALNFHSYIRFDIRLRPDGQVFILEPNANPCLARIDEFALSASKKGIDYNDLIRKIVTLALQNKN